MIYSPFLTYGQLCFLRSEKSWFRNLQGSLSSPHTVYTVCSFSPCGNVRKPYCSGADLLMSCWCMPTDGVFSLRCWLLMWNWQSARMGWLCGFYERDSIIILIYSIVQSWCLIDHDDVCMCVYSSVVWDMCMTVIGIWSWCVFWGLWVCFGIIQGCL